MSATSVVIPFADADENRQRVLDWLLRYWEHHLPNAEFIVQPGPDSGFSKTEVLNAGIEASSGSVIVALDADALIPAGEMLRSIEIAESGIQWAMPYGRMYRLSMGDTETVLALDPTSFDPEQQIDAARSVEQPRAVHFGAMAQVYPKEGWEAVGGFDTRFRGWGSEDEHMKLALDCLWAPSHVLDGNVFHLEHDRPGKRNVLRRKWANQQDSLPNQDLRNEYVRAKDDPVKMRELLSESR